MFVHCTQMGLAQTTRVLISHHTMNHSGASPSNKKGGFDRHAPVTYASATGNANPSWLN